MKHTRKFAFIILLILGTSFSGIAQPDNVKFITYNKEETNYLKADDFYLTHYLYIDLFLRESLYVNVTEEDVAYILNMIKKNVSLESPLDIEITLNDKDIYKLRIKLAQKDDEKLFIAFTNFNPNTNKFEEFGDDSYTRWYFLNEEKMTYRKDLSKEKDYDKLDEINLINAYLLDELSSNDSEIDPLILTIQEKKETKNVADQLMIDLSLLKYSIYKNEEEKTSNLLKSISDALKNDNSHKRIAQSFEATKFQIKVMALLKEN